MLSFPAVLSTELKNDSKSVKYFVKLERKLIASPYTRSYVYFTNDDCIVYDDDESANVTAIGSLAGDISISDRIDIRSHTSSVGGFSIDLIDLGHANISDLFATYDIYNSPIEIWVISESNTTADGCLLYKGICGIPTYTPTRISLPIENSTYTVNLEMGESLIDQADKVQRDVPTDSLGEVKPIIYGDHVSNIGHTTTATNNFSKRTNLIKCVDMGDDLNWSSGAIGTRTKNWYVAQHECKSVDEIWAYDTDLKDFAKLTAFNTVQNDSTRCVVSHTNRIDRYTYFYPTEVPSDLKVIVNSGAVSNEANMVDMDLSTYGSISAQDVDDISNVKSAQIDVLFENNVFYEKFDNAEITGIDVYVKTNYSHQGSSGNEVVDMIGYGGIFGTIDIRGWTNDTTFNTQAFSTTNKSDTQPRVRFKIASAYGGVSYPTRELKIYGMFIRVKYTPKDDHDIYFGGTGIKDDGSGTVTGSAGALIENPSHIAEHIARNYMGLATGGIDTTSFDNVNTELTSNYKLAFGINKSINSKKLLEKISYQGKSHFRFNAVNKLSADTFYASNSADIDGITLDHILSISFSKISLKNLVNKLYLNYYNDTKKNNHQIIRSYDTANTGSQVRYNVVSEKVINANFIKTDTTAGLFADHWVKDSADSFWSFPRNIIDVELITSRKDFLALEVSDIIEFDDSSIDSYKKVYGVSIRSKEFKIISITKNLQSVKIKAIEV